MIRTNILIFPKEVYEDTLQGGRIRRYFDSKEGDANSRSFEHHLVGGKPNLDKICFQFFQSIGY